MDLRQLASEWASHESSIISAYASIRSIEASIAAIKASQLSCEHRIINAMRELGKSVIDVDGRTITIWQGASGGTHVVLTEKAK